MTNKLFHDKLVVVQRSHYQVLNIVLKLYSFISDKDKTLTVRRQSQLILLQ